MGKFDSRRKERTARKYGFKEPKANSFLIVSEGEETEPIYFNSFGQLIKDTVGGNIETVNIPYLTVEGKGRSTIQLLSEVEKIVSKSRIIYQYVWVLFDKDQFDDFDDAIKLGEEKGYYVAWSNYCFEYWLTLHFNYSDSALNSSTLQESLSKTYKKLGIADGNYSKNDPNVYNIAEHGVGLNPKCHFCGFMLEDEGVFGTCHIGIGTSITLGGTVKAACHYDVIMKDGTIVADGKTLMKDGVPQV